MGNWKHFELTEQELKELVRNVYDGKVFTSLQCRHDWQSVFMVSLFLGSPPSQTSLTGNIKTDRRNKLEYMRDCEIYKQETPEREKYIDDIGMFYENISEAGPRSINGYPMFFSCKIVSKEDTKRFVEMYNKYIKMREEFEKDWK